jgi:TolA-binding protein
MDSKERGIQHPPLRTPHSDEVHFALGRIALLEGEYEKALSHFTLVGDGFKPATSKTIDPFLMGYCSENLSNLEEAIGFYGLSLESLVDDHARFRIGNILAKMGWVNAAIAVYSSFTDRCPESVHFLSALKKIPRLLEKEERWEEAITKRSEILTKIQKGKFSSLSIKESRLRSTKIEMKMGIARNYEKLEKKKEAQNIYWEVIRNYPSYSYALRALSALSRINKEKKFSSKERYYVGRVEFLHGRYSKAIENFRAYLKKHSKGAKSRRAERLLADAHYNTKRFEEAKKIYQRIYSRMKRTRSPSPDREQGTPVQILFRIARCEERQGRENEAYKRFLELVNDYPGSYLSDDALYRSGMIFEREGNDEESLPIYERLVMEISQGDYVDDGWYRLGLASLRLGDIDLAHFAFYGFLRSPSGKGSSHRPGSLYWLGKIYEEKGDSSRMRETYQLLIQQYPNHYYTFLSRGETVKWLHDVSPMGQMPEDNNRTSVDTSFLTNYQLPITDVSVESWIASWSDTLYNLSPEEEIRFERGKRFLKMGLIREGRLELSRIQESNPLFLYRLAKIYKNAGIDYNPLVLVEQIRQQYKARNEKFGRKTKYFKSSSNALPYEIQKLLYPISYLPTLKMVFRETPMENDSIQHSEEMIFQKMSLFLAVMRMESGFNPRAVSRVGARGLSQIMPETGERISIALNDPDFKVKDLFNPKKNIRYGSWYLSALVDTVREIVNNGEWKEENFEDYVIPLTLASYNGGPHNVRDWVERGILNNGNWELAIESIPFHETRKFVKKVLGNEGVYRDILLRFNVDPAKETARKFSPFRNNILKN